MTSARLSARSWSARMALALGALIAADQMAPSMNLASSAPAQAVVGMPATPVSVAGVARRTTRRTVAATSATAAATTTAPVPAPAPTVVVVETQAPAAPQPQPQPQQAPQ